MKSSIKNSLPVFLLITYSLLFVVFSIIGPYTNSFGGPVIISGTVVDLDEEKVLISNWKSSAFWDESDIGDKNESLVLYGDDFGMLVLGEEVTAKVKIIKRGELETINIESSNFDPTNLYWKPTWVLLFLALYLLSLYFARKKPKVPS